jgi:hypothetical protein
MFVKEENCNESGGARLMKRSRPQTRIGRVLGCPGAIGQHEWGGSFSIAPQMNLVFSGKLFHLEQRLDEREG